jgi:hypothetical protein
VHHNWGKIPGGTIEKNGRSAQTQSRIDDQGAQISAEGSSGGNVEISQDRGSTSREISGNTASGTAFEGESQRTTGGRQTDLSTDAGGQASLYRNDGNRTGVGQTAGGDIYAGRNGNIYKRTDDGWSQYDNGSWNNVNRSNSRSSSASLTQPSYSQSGQFKRDYNNLNRQYNARQSGYNNYNQYRNQMGSRSGNLNRSRTVSRRQR